MTEDAEVTEEVPSFVICPVREEGGSKCKVMMQHCKISVLELVPFSLGLGVTVCLLSLLGNIVLHSIAFIVFIAEAN